MNSAAKRSANWQVRWLLVITLLLLTPSTGHSDFTEMVRKAGNKFATCATRFCDIINPTGKGMRYHFGFEISEQSWLPSSVRDSVLTALGFTGDRFSGEQEIVHDAIANVIKKTGSNVIIEMGSGAGYAAKNLNDSLHKAGHDDVMIYASDLFPQPKEWEKRFKETPRVKPINVPISFTHFPEQLKGQDLRGTTIMVIAAFHHIRNPEARKFLENAAKAGANVVIIEPLERDLRSAILAAGATAPAMLAPFLEKDISIWSRAKLALFTFAVPIIPATFLHDGIMSTLRQRNDAEWAKLYDGLPFDVEVKKRQGPMQNFTVHTFTYQPPAKPSVEAVSSIFGATAPFTLPGKVESETVPSRPAAAGGAR